MTEHDEQVALIQWAAHAVSRYPELALLYAVPNAGKRSYRAGLWMTAEGLRAGVPDLHIPVARQGYNSLFIEMKYGKGNLRPEQAAWIDKLRAYGNKVVVCWSCDEAIAVIEDYLEA